jgi:hypothetical protein
MLETASNIPDQFDDFALTRSSSLKSRARGAASRTKPSFEGVNTIALWLF